MLILHEHSRHPTFPDLSQQEESSQDHVLVTYSLHSIYHLLMYHLPFTQQGELRQDHVLVTYSLHSIHYLHMYHLPFTQQGESSQDLVLVTYSLHIQLPFTHVPSTIYTAGRIKPGSCAHRHGCPVLMRGWQVWLSAKYPVMHRHTPPEHCACALHSSLSAHASPGGFFGEHLAKST